MKGILGALIEGRAERAYDAAQETLGRRPTRCIAGRWVKGVLAPYVDDGMVPAFNGLVMEFSDDVPPRSIRFE